MDLGPRAGSSQVSLWNLPEELILCILKGLHIKDVLSMRSVHSIFRDIIDDCSTVWNAASFQDAWPSPNNIHYFERAAEFGNMEALIKMAIAYLYNVGMPEGMVWSINGVKAAKLFCQIEAMTPFEPFTWLFFRPSEYAWEPVTKNGVLVYMEDYLQNNNKQDTKNLNVCVAKSLRLLDVAEFAKQKRLPSQFEKEADVLLSNARQLGSGCAALLLWQKQYHDILSTDKARKQEGVRKLREIAEMNHFDSKISLCKMYANGEYGGITPKQGAMYVQELVQSTTPTNTQECFKTSQEVTTSMRYSLVDWLVETTRDNHYSSHTLHIAVSVVDRYLKCHKTTRSKLQLLGVSAMILCSRFLEKELITINKITSFLYNYAYDCASVSRMMGEITATLRGNIRVPNSLDFVEIFSSVAELDKKCSCLAEYLCELTLLHAEMGQYSPAEIAASSVLLARLLIKLDLPWPDKMVQFSGFTIEDIRRCTFHMYENCFLKEPVVDRLDEKLENVKLRYAEEKFHKVSRIPIMSYEELCVDLECGSESDTYFASISKLDKNIKMPFNISFSTIPSDKITHNAPQKSCQESSSRVSSPNAVKKSPSCS